MSDIQVVEGGTIKVTPDFDWFWDNWDGIIELTSKEKSLKINGKNVITENDIPEFQFESEAYKTKLHNISGTISSVRYFKSSSTERSKDKVKNERILTDKSKGLIVASVTKPAEFKTPNGVIVPDIKLFKTGTWEIETTGQEVVKDEKVYSESIEEPERFSLENFIDDDTPSKNNDVKIKTSGGQTLKGSTDNEGKLVFIKTGSDTSGTDEVREVSVGPSEDDPLQPLRNELKKTLDKVIEENEKLAAAYHDTYKDLGTKEKILLHCEAFFEAFYQNCEKLYDSTVKLYDNVRNMTYEDFEDIIVEIDDKRKELFNSAYNAIKNFKLEDLEKIIAKIENVKGELKEAYDDIVLLLGDKEIRYILLSFLDSYIKTLNSMKIAEISGDGAFYVLLALVTRGAYSAGGALSKSKHLNKAADVIRRIIKKIKEIKKGVKKIKQKPKGKLKVKGEKIKSSKSSNNKKKNESKKCSVNGGTVNNSECGGDPISMITGEELFQQADFVLSGPIQLTLQRTYRSKNRLFDYGLGHGWAFSIFECLFLTKDHLIFQDSEGREILCLLPEIGKHSIQGVEGLTIIRESEHTFRLKQDDMPDKLFEPNTVLGQPVKKYVDYNSKTFSNPECIYKNESGHLIYRNSNANDVFCLLTENNEQTRYVIQDIEIIKTTDNSFLMKQTGKPDRTFSLMLPLSKYIDLDNNYIDFQSNQNGLLDRIQTSFDQQVLIEHDLKGRISALKYIGHNEHETYDLVRYHYENNDLTQVTDANGHSEYFQYYNHLITKKTLKTGFSFSLEWAGYEDGPRCIRSYGDNNIYDYRFEWYPDEKRSKSIDSRGVVNEFWYNKFGLIDKIIDGEGHVTQYEYDYAGRRTKIISPNADVYRFEYDDNGRLAQFIDPSDQSQIFRYDEKGLPIEWEDPTGAIWKQEFKSDGKQVEITNPLGHTTVCENNDQGFPEIITDPQGNRRSYEWDKGKLQSATSPLGKKINYTYDDMGNLSKVTFPDGSITELISDISGNITQIVNSEGEIKKLYYNEAGDLIRFIDNAGRVTRYEYDGLSQVVTRIDPDGSQLKYEYDKERNLTALINQNGERSEFKYDNNERLIEEVGFDGRIQRYEYDNSGELAGYFDGQNYIQFIRDHIGNLLEMHCNKVLLCKYTYDQMNRLIEAINSDSHVKFVYDDAGYLKEEHQNDAVIKHEYTANGLLDYSILPDGKKLTYDYDHDDDLKRISLNGKILHDIIQRDDLGREKIVSQGQLQTQYEYDLVGRVKLQNIGKPDTISLINRKYGYNTSGNLQSIEDSFKGKTTYQYDALDRLKSVQGIENEIFSFDPAGNIYEQETNSRCGYVVGNRLRLMGDRYFYYDAAGNLIKETRGKHGEILAEYKYNTLNQLIAVKKGTQTFEYKYDALGRRIYKKNASGDTYFLWNGNVLLSEKSDSNSKTYIFEPETFLPVAFVQNDSVYHYHLDHLGTPQEITNENGKIVWSVNYRAYGEVLKFNVEEITNNLRFQGQYFDEETGFHYNRFRYYDPRVGRFINQDPVGFIASNNFYNYAANPTGWIDPFGLRCFKRYEPGVVSGNGVEITGTWLQGTGGQIGKFPKQIADSLRGQEFKNFDAFRKAFWKAVAEDDNLKKEFTKSNITHMKNENAPFVIKSERYGGHQRYILHHIKPIYDGGGVYDIDNIIIVTPRTHQLCLEPTYHFGRSN